MEGMPGLADSTHVDGDVQFLRVVVLQVRLHPAVGCEERGAVVAVLLPHASKPGCRGASVDYHRPLLRGAQQELTRPTMTISERVVWCSQSCEERLETTRSDAMERLTRLLMPLWVVLTTELMVISCGTSFPNSSASLTQTAPAQANSWFSGPLYNTCTAVRTTRIEPARKNREIETTWTEPCGLCRDAARWHSHRDATVLMEAQDHHLDDIVSRCVVLPASVLTRPRIPSMTMEVFRISSVICFLDRPALRAKANDC